VHHPSAIIEVKKLEHLDKITESLNDSSSSSSSSPSSSSSDLSNSSGDNQPARQENNFLGSPQSSKSASRFKPPYASLAAPEEMTPNRKVLLKTKSKRFDRRQSVGSLNLIPPLTNQSSKILEKDVLIDKIQNTAVVIDPDEEKRNVLEKLRGIRSAAEMKVNMRKTIIKT